MKAIQLVRTRITYSASAFAELMLWQLQEPVAGSVHSFKYRLAYVVDGVCVLRYDNEIGKGGHRHFAGKERAYIFKTPDKLTADFQRDIARWNRENHNS
ncbi:MAG: toxin-antitoxin system TumE family protein [Sulfuricella sp.]